MEFPLFKKKKRKKLWFSGDKKTKQTKTEFLAKEKYSYLSFNFGEILLSFHISNTLLWVEVQLQNYVQADMN